MINLINQGHLESVYYFRGCNNLSSSSESILMIDQRNTSKRLRTQYKKASCHQFKNLSISMYSAYVTAPFK